MLKFETRKTDKNLKSNNVDLLSTHYCFKSTPVAFCSNDSSSYLQHISGYISAKWQTIKHENYRFDSYNIKTHSCVSLAKKAVKHTTVLFTGITNSPFSILVSITTWPISIKFTYVLSSIYTTLPNIFDGNPPCSLQDLKLPHFPYNFLLFTIIQK